MTARHAEPSGSSVIERLDIDRLERRYRAVYPLHVFLENGRQVVAVSAIALVVAACVYFLQHALSSASEATPKEIQIFLVTAFASIVAVGYISLWNLTVRNLWKASALVTLTIALALGWSLYTTGTQLMSPLADILTQLRTVAPIFALLLLAAIALTAAYYAHLVWVLLEASFGLVLVNASDRGVLRDRPSRKASAGFGASHRYTGSCGGHRSAMCRSSCCRCSARSSFPLWPSCRSF